MAMSSSDKIMRFMAYDHLPQHLQEVSKPFYDLAAVMKSVLPEDPELTMCLRHIRYAKDCAVGLAAYVESRGVPHA